MSWFVARGAWRDVRALSHVEHVPKRERRQMQLGVWKEFLDLREHSARAGRQGGARAL